MRKNWSDSERKLTINLHVLKFLASISKWKSFLCYCMYVQEENVELKRQKLVSSENYSWTDYMSLPFTQNVSPKWIIYSMFILYFLCLLKMKLTMPMYVIVILSQGDKWDS